MGSGAVCCTYEGPHTPVYGLLAFLLISPFMSVPLQLLMSLLHKKGGGVSVEHLTSSSVSYCWLLGLMCGALGLMTGSLHAHSYDQEYLLGVLDIMTKSTDQLISAFHKLYIL